MLVIDMRLIDGDALKCKAQKVATEAWKMKIAAKVETTLNQFIDWINAAPTIEPETEEEAYERGYTAGQMAQRKTERWIPVSERLPEEFGEYLACRKNGTVEKMFYNPILTTRYPKGFSIVNNNFSWRQDNVIAWMPLPALPEPYKGEICLN